MEEGNTLMESSHSHLSYLICLVAVGIKWIWNRAVCFVDIVIYTTVIHMVWIRCCVVRRLLAVQRPEDHVRCSLIL